ncbi:unnamed protein product [Periconia digitata]|uniref:F-box domain-containing protein n=1 Tax=Periconia digitata TaxID=1303443 RepID=A0A9W4UHP1_9PLEO|nr:unnamed protein product [Periconia digitata]
MSLSKLPNELLDNIVLYLDTEKDIAAIARTNCRFHAHLNSYLYSYNIQHSKASGLLWAAEDQKLETIHKFFAENQKTIPTEYLTTPLCAAASGGHAKAVACLLDNGASINARKPREADAGMQATALLSACSAQCMGVVKVLLERGANTHLVDLGDGEEWSPLQIAIMKKNVELVALLLDHGADVNEPVSTANRDESSDEDDWVDDDPEEDTTKRSIPLNLACEEGFEEIVRILLAKGAKTDGVSGTYGTALQAAVDGGHEDIVKQLLDHGADVNAEGTYYLKSVYAHHSDTPLCGAAENGFMGIAKLLLKKGAQVNANGGLNGNPLQAAAQGGHTEMVELLLNHGADVNAQAPYFDYGMYEFWQVGALYIASLAGHVDVVELLLSQEGIDVNLAGGHYGNALQAAASRNWVGIVELLLEKGADVNAHGGYYETAAKAAAEQGFDELCKMLESYAKMNIEPASNHS